MTAPRGNVENAVAGLGGQNVPAGDFVRAGVGMGSAKDIQNLIDEIQKMNGREQAVRAELLSLGVGMLSDEAVRRSSSVDEAPETTTARTALRAAGDQGTGAGDAVALADDARLGGVKFAFGRAE